MPLSSYFGGSGDQVMSSMKDQYGPSKGKRVFYATANKRSKKSKKKHGAKAQARALEEMNR